MTAFTLGQRVKVRWSGKTGWVLDPGLRHYPDATPCVLVLLDPFVARWRRAWSSCVVSLEVIYATEDLEALCPNR